MHVCICVYAEREEEAKEVYVCVRMFVYTERENIPRRYMHVCICVFI